MRSLTAAAVMLATAASASGTVVNPDLHAEHAPSLVSRQASSALRLREIDDELYTLEVRPTGGQVFLKTGALLAPWFLIGAAPMMVVGGALGLVKADSSNSAFNVAAAGAAGTLLIVGAILLVVCVFKVFDHWMDEANTSREREGRIRQLRTERQDLVLWN